MPLHFPHVHLLPVERYALLLGSERMEQVQVRFAELRARLQGRVVWNVSSTAVGGGVAEMVRSLLAYARGAGVDARWVVIDGPPAFFRLTKRLHHALHGSAGDGSPLGDAERRLYERVACDNAAELLPLVQPRDVVVVHDPQPAGLIAPLARLGAHVIWRCHIGEEDGSEEAARGWQFLAPYLAPAAACVFTRAAYVPPVIDPSRVAIITPSIDPFSAKNQPLAGATVRAILAQAGIIEHGGDAGAARYLREDGTPGRVDRFAEVLRDGPPPSAAAPLVVQVSRWDRLKDPLGVLAGFARLQEAGGDPARAFHLVLAGPNARGVADDPEGAEVFGEAAAAWRALLPPVRARASLVSLPTVDVDENAAMVNALQRHAAIVVQKSLREGFGLTVAEAMWKARPVVASAVGGIRDQIDDGVQGLLIADPRDLDAFAAVLAALAADPDRARRLGEAGRERALERFLGVDSLLRFGALIEAIDAERGVEPRAGPP